MQRLAIIDFETTGLRAGPDRIIEVAAVLLEDGVVVATFAELMDPGFRIPAFITRFTGISDAMVHGRPPPEAVMPRLRVFLGDHVCLAHNAAFDQRFFTTEMAAAGQAHPRDFVCSLLLSRRLIRGAPNHQLGTLVQHLGLAVPPGLRAHRALDDVQMTCGLWRHLDAALAARLGRAPDLALIQAVMRKPKAVVEAYLATCASPALLQAAR